jgi:hypothetical protein
MQCGYVVEGETSPGVEMSPSERARLSLEKKRRRARFKTERRPRGRLPSSSPPPPPPPPHIFAAFVLMTTHSLTA